MGNLSKILIVHLYCCTIMQLLDSNSIPTINNGALEVTTKEVENKTHATVTQYNSDMSVALHG